MAHIIRFLLYNRFPQPHYPPLGADTLVDAEPHYEQSQVYRLRLVSSTDDIATWPELVVIRMSTEPVIR